MASEDAMGVPGLVDDNMEQEDVKGIGWDDDDDDDDDDDGDLMSGPVKCLFCDSILNSALEVISHCASSHAFCLVSYCRRWSLDCIGYIKLVNFIRKQRPSVEALRELQPSLDKEQCAWSDDSYMMPVDPDDLMLQFDIESDECGAGEGGGSAGPASDTQEEVVLKASQLHALIQRAREAEAKAAALQGELDRAVADLIAVRQAAQGLIGVEGLTSDLDGDRPAARGEEGVGAESSVERLTLEEDENYFSGYGNIDIHAEMLKDKVRTESYRDFILGNGDLFHGKTVLDVGCGTGILSMFAAKAGASHVIGVDQSDIIYSAMDISRENGLEQNITFLKGRMDFVQLPFDKVDIIVSEWMGYFLLFESMLDTVIGARNKYLADGGKVYPDKCSLWLAGFSDEDMRSRAVDFWDDVYGFKMSCLKADVMSQTAVDVMQDDKLVTLPCMIKEFDVNTCSVSDVNFKSAFSLTCSTDTLLHGLLGYFDIGFEAGADKQVHFSTGPSSASTHWKQTVFLFKCPVSVTKGQVLQCSIKVDKNREDPRSLDIKILVDGVSHKYTMD